MGDLSPHFDNAEFRCPDGTTHPIDPYLIEHLEALRHICGDRPLHILSGYRSPDYNRRVGGAPNSQHMYGRAADIPIGYATRQQARDAGFSGIGYEGDHVVHVDVRPWPRVEFYD